MVTPSIRIRESLRFEFRPEHRLFPIEVLADSHSKSRTILERLNYATAASFLISSS
jgi:hypothetical protein